MTNSAKTITDLALCDMAVRSLPGCVAEGYRLVPVEILHQLRSHILFAHYTKDGFDRRREATNLANSIVVLLAAAPGGKGE